MPTFTTRIVIAAEPERVWGVLTDFARWPEWTASMTAVRPEGSSPPGAGSRVWIQQPKLQPGYWTITDWQPPRSFTWEVRQSGLRVVALHDVASAGRGSEVTLEVRMDGALAGLVGLVSGALTRRYMKMEAEGLRARSEGSGG